MSTVFDVLNDQRRSGLCDVLRTTKVITVYEWKTGKTIKQVDHPSEQVCFCDCQLKKSADQN